MTGCFPSLLSMKRLCFTVLLAGLCACSSITTTPTVSQAVGIDGQVFIKNNAAASQLAVENCLDQGPWP